MKRSPLPWDEAKARDAQEVARRLLRLQEAREARKFSCLECKSSDALHARPEGGFFCYSCGKGWSNVDAVAHVLGIEPAEACREIAQAFGIPFPDAGAGRPTFRPHPSRPRKAVEAPRMAGKGEVVPEAARDVYRATLETLKAEGTGSTELSPAGLAYLEGRKLAPEASGWYGFRSVEGAQGWDRLRQELEKGFPLEALEASGWWSRTEQGELRYSPPFGGRAPALVIPYWDLQWQVVGLRFRSLSARDKGSRYRDLPGKQPALPFNAPALHGLEASSSVVHLVEGELNAWTLHLRDAVAVGLPGAGKPWEQGWPALFRHAELLVLWFDTDEAGERGLRRAVDTLAGTLGPSWVRARVRRERLPPGRDVNDLERSGELGAYFQRGWNG